MTAMNGRYANPFWGIVVGASGGFCVTILAYLASGLGSPAAPLNQFFTRYGFLLICVETAVIVITGLLALAMDRRQAVRRRRPAPAGDVTVASVVRPE
jgi:hypothetical protein